MAAARRMAGEPGCPVVRSSDAPSRHFWFPAWSKYPRHGHGNLVVPALDRGKEAKAGKGERERLCPGRTGQAARLVRRSDGRGSRPRLGSGAADRIASPLRCDPGLAVPGRVSSESWSSEARLERLKRCGTTRPVDDRRVIGGIYSAGGFRQAPD
jgi:hypothetical protein